MHRTPSYILPLIVVSQFAGTSLWFASNAILPELIAEGHPVSVSLVTSMVQFGFIAGTLFFALFSIADRFKSSRVFFISCILAALANILLIPLAKHSDIMLILRFITGFFLAGIYPVGMKIAADWYEKGLGKALGWLVGALVLGTAFPHLLKSGYFYLGWKLVIILTSCLALAGGFLILLFVGEGPYRVKNTTGFQPRRIFSLFSIPRFRSAALGYFGHMWELYAFWAFVPFLIALNGKGGLDGSLWSFLVIGVGALSCVLGGYLSLRYGNAKVAFIALLVSGLCCFTAALFIAGAPVIFLAFMLLWGMAVVADSPQFSTLVAQAAPNELKGTGITLVTSIGFAITVVSMSVIEMLLNKQNSTTVIFMVLGIGPALGLIATWMLVKKRDPR